MQRVLVEALAAARDGELDDAEDQSAGRGVRDGPEEPRPQLPSRVATVLTAIARITAPNRYERRAW